MNVSLRASILAGLAGVALYAPAAHASDGWDWMVAPYAWFTTIDADANLSLPPPGGNATDTHFDNVLGDLDGAFEVHLEGQGDHWGMLADFTYLGLQSDNSFDRFDTSADLDARLFELAATWSPDDQRFEGFEVLAGLRYIDLDISLDFDPVNPAFANSNARFSDTYADFMLGARYTIPMSDKWSLTLRGDGSWGATEGTWNVSAMATRKTSNGAWVFGWRYLSGTIKPDDRDVDVTMNGPVLGYAFKF